MVLLALLVGYYAATVIVQLALGALFPWDPPKAEDAPRGAVLRVIAPEGEPYRIDWGLGLGIQRGEVPSGDAYVDYTVPYEALDSEGTFNVSIETGSPYIIEEEEIDLGVILFVDGAYAQCRGDSNNADLYWHSSEGLGGFLRTSICGSHRWSIFPDPMRWVGL